MDPFTAIMASQLGTQAAGEAGGLVSNILNYVETKKHNEWYRENTEQLQKWQQDFAGDQFDWQKSEAETNRTFQEEQLDKLRSDAASAVQTKAKDMAAAGINPLLAGNSSGAALASSITSGSTPQTVSPAVASAGGILSPNANFSFGSKIANALGNWSLARERDTQANLNIEKAVSERVNQLLTKVETVHETVKIENTNADTKLKNASEALNRQQILESQQKIELMAAQYLTEKEKTRFVNSLRVASDADFYRVLALTEQIELTTEQMRTMNPIYRDKVLAELKNIRAQTRVIQSAEVRKWVDDIINNGISIWDAIQGSKRKRPFRF